MNGATVECPSCREQIKPGDDYCAGCGAPVSDEVREQLRRADAREARAHIRAARASRERKSKMAKAAAWILVVAILIAASGTILGFLAKSTADDALRVLSMHEDDDLFQVEGEVKTVREWREAVEAEPRLIFITNYALAVVMLAIFFWARAQPFPAIVTALSIFLAVWVVSAVIDPTAIFQGIIIKVIVIVVLGGGLKAALAERVAAQGGARTGPRRRTARARRR